MQIQERIRDIINVGSVDIIFLTGGTGLSPRDRTPEAVRPLLDFEIPGIGELLRASGAAKTPMSWLSRSIAGVIGKTLVISLPGSKNAVVEGIAALTPILNHAVHIARGGRH